MPPAGAASASASASAALAASDGAVTVPAGSRADFDAHIAGAGEAGGGVLTVKVQLLLLLWQLLQMREQHVQEVVVKLLPLDLR